MTAAPVVGLNRPPAPVLRIRLHEHSEAPYLERVHVPSRLQSSPNLAAIALLAAILGAIVTSISAVVRLDFLSFILYPLIWSFTTTIAVGGLIVTTLKLWP